MDKENKEAILVKSWKEMRALSWFLHLLSLFLGFLLIGIIVNSWISGVSISSSGGEVSNAVSLLLACIFVLFGLAPFIHFRFTLFSLSLLFLFGSLLAIETGQIKSGMHCCTYYRDTDPYAFYFWVVAHFLIFIFGAIWAWTVKPTLPNQPL